MMSSVQARSPRHRHRHRHRLAYILTPDTRDFLARILARMSVSVSWNADFSAHSTTPFTRRSPQIIRYYRTLRIDGVSPRLQLRHVTRYVLTTDQCHLRRHRLVINIDLFISYFMLVLYVSQVKMGRNFWPNDQLWLGLLGWWG